MSVVRLIVATRSSGQPASQPAISSLVVKLLNKCRVRFRVGHPI